MTTKVISACSLAALLLACAHGQGKESARGDETTVARRADGPGTHEERTEVAAGQADSMGADSGMPRGEADNSAVNEGEHRGAGTAQEQGNGEVDVELTQRIRQAVVADDALSFTAKNTKIITNDGHVTLRGPVKTAAEKESIYQKAVAAAGAGRVTNELEVDGD